MHFTEFILKLEDAIGTAVTGAAPLSWDENHLSYSVLDAVRCTLSGAQIHGLHRPCRIAAQAYKLRGNPERRYGDIAVLVRLTSWDAQVLEGVGFLEAKKRGLDGHGFEAFKMQQARRINRSAPRAQLLLYDAADITGFADNSALLFHPIEWPQHCIHFLVPKTHALCTPLSTAVHVGTCSASLYKYGLPLSVQLACRFLRGFDLEFTKAPLAAASGFVTEGAGGVRYVLAIGVSIGGEGEPTPPAVNSDAYGALGEGAA